MLRAVLAAGPPRAELLWVSVPEGAATEGLPLPSPLRKRVAALLAAKRFRGRWAETFLLEADRQLLLLLGLGAARELDARLLRGAAGEAGRCARRLGVRAVACLWPALERPEPPAAARALVEGFFLGAYRPPRAGRRREGRGIPTLRVHGPREIRPAVQRGRAVAAAVHWTRDLVQQPGNLLGPQELARRARQVGREGGYRVRVAGPAELRRLGCGGILAVGGGSARSPCLIRLDSPRRRGRPLVALVGKGITFDTGGISLKPAQGMEKMKYDMAGAAAVLGILQAAAALHLPVNLVAFLGVAENMPSGRAYRPGDVIRQADGTTVEVVNTDAEGRLVLADALSLAARLEPDAILDLATLTGACFIALGAQAVGLMSNDEGLARQVEAAGERAGERVWRLPLWKEYRNLIESDVADLKNSGGREAATITAGKFLEHFVRGRPWAHLDIAGTAWSEAEKGHLSRGATGVGVSLVTRYLEGLP